MYNKIVNPKTGRKVNINSNLGKKIIKKYLNVLNGGMRIYITPDWIDNYESLHLSDCDNDCVPCSFNFLGINRGFARIMQQQYKGGLTDKQMLEILNRYFPNYNLAFIKHPLTSLAEIYKTIPNNMAAFVVLQFEGRGLRHAIVLAKGYDGKPYLFDPQNYKHVRIRGYQRILKALKTNKTTHISILNITDVDGKILIRGKGQASVPKRQASAPVVTGMEIEKPDIDAHRQHQHAKSVQQSYRPRRQLRQPYRSQPYYRQPDRRERRERRKGKLKKPLDKTSFTRLYRQAREHVQEAREHDRLGIGDPDI